MTTATISYLDGDWKIRRRREVALDRDKLERRISALIDLGLYIVSMTFHDEGQGEFEFEEATA